MFKHAAVVLAVSLFLVGVAQAEVVNAYWSFNDNSPDVTAVTSASSWESTHPAVSFSADGSQYKDDADFPTFTAFDGIDYDGTSAAQWQANGALVDSPTMTILIDMAGLEDLTLGLDIRAAALPGGNPPSGTEAIEYSTDGLNWSDAGLAQLTGFSTTVTRYSLDFSSIAAIEDVSTAGIRLTFEDVDGTDGLANVRLDNVQLGATVIPEPATLALLGLGAVGMIRRRRA
jgi:hypothetical protein